jgi:hypothetical protein
MRAEEIVMRIPSQWKKLFLVVPFLLAVFLLTAAPTSQMRATDSNTALFLPAVDYPSGGQFATSVAVADLNGDGKVDVVVANANSNTVGVLLGNGNGTFQPATTYGSGGIFPISAAVADVNGDGKPDVVVANAGVIGCGVGVLLGNGDGTFQTPLVYCSGGLFADSVAVADVNGDGNPDLLVANLCADQTSDCSGSGESGVGVMLGNGDGTFQSAVTYSSGGSFIQSIAVADVDGDGRPDLMVANLCPLLQAARCPGTTLNGTAGVLLNNGNGTFGPVVAHNSGGFQTFSIAVADVNSDGNPDLVVVSSCISSTNCGTGVAGVLLGNGGGGFGRAVTYRSASSVPFSGTVADVNGDHKPDLLMASGGSVDALLGNGDGTFQAAVSYATGGIGSGSVTGAPSIVAADVNGDTTPDVLVATCADSSCDGSVGVLLNNSAPLDTTPPTITLSSTPKALWPVDGKMVPVAISGTITDTGSGVNPNSAAYAVQDEYARVQPKGAITLGAGGNYSFTVFLQASRLGTDLDGRRYTIAVGAKDNAGNAASKSVAVIVPHDQGH